MVVPRSYPFGFRSVTYPSQYCRALGPKFFTCSFLPYKTISIYIYIYIFFSHVRFFFWVVGDWGCRWIAIHRYYGRGKGTLQAWLIIYSIVSLRSNVCCYLLCCRWLLGCVSLGRWLWLNTYHPSSAWKALGLSTIFLCSGLGPS